jgi:hypothetical protein
MENPLHAAAAHVGISLAGGSTLIAIEQIYAVPIESYKVLDIEPIYIVGSIAIIFFTILMIFFIVNFRFKELNPK